MSESITLAELGKYLAGSFLFFLAVESVIDYCQHPEDYRNIFRKRSEKYPTSSDLDEPWIIRNRYKE